MELLDFNSTLLFVLRWFHILAGICWIGLLYFFNFVNIPFQGALAGDLKPRVNPILLGRALFWFRWGAMFTFLFGLLLFFTKYIGTDILRDAEGNISDRSLWIMVGMTFGIIMWFNVWFIIWPAQKQILGGLASGTPPADGPALVKRAVLASRINTYLSAPMLFCMIAPTHYPSFAIGNLVLVMVFGFAVIKFLYVISPNVGKEFSPTN